MKARVFPKDDKKDYLRKTKERSRTKYSPDQIRALEGFFITCQYPDTDIMQALSDKLVVSIEKVSIWFQNRRSKFKRQSKNAHTAWMRQQLYNQDNVIRSTPKTKQTEKKHVLTPPEPSKEDCSFISQNANLYYGSFQAQCPNLSPQTYANQQHKEINPTVPDSHHNQKPLSINDLVNDLSQYQYNMNYTSQSMAGIHAAYPSSYARCYPGLYYPYSAQYPYGQFPPIDFLYYGSSQAQCPNLSPQTYANQQHKEINPTVPDSHHNQKPLSINDLVNDLSQYQYNMNYTSQSMAGIHAAYPSSYARCYPGLYYPYSAQYPYGQFPPIDFLYYGSSQAQCPNLSPQTYANQQHKEINPTVPDSHHNQKPLSINDLVNDLSQYQYNMNYTSQSMAGIHAAYPSSYARCYPGLYYPYSAQYPYGQFPPIDL